MTNSLDSTIFEKKPRFLAIFIVTSLIGVLLISVSVYHASRELEVIHEVDNMSRIVRSLLGETALRQLVRGERASAQGEINITAAPGYRFFNVSENGLQALQPGAGADLRLLQSIDLESTRVNERGGYFEADGAIRTWVRIHDGDNTRALLVVHTFSSAGVGALAHVYRQRVIIPVFFYIWLTVWVALIFSYLLRELRGQTDRMRRMALHDVLTDLPNRKLMQERMLKQIADSRRDGSEFAFGVIDLNGFKGINDRHGHSYGDELLRQAGKRIEAALRSVDTVARFGGDEFTVLLSPTDEPAWQAVFERIRVTLNAPYTLLDAQVTVSASIGVAIFPAHGADADTLLLNADRAMYVAKARGGGINVFEPGAVGRDRDAMVTGTAAGDETNAPGRA